MKVTYGAGFYPTVSDPDSLVHMDASGHVAFNVPDKSPAVIRRRIREFARMLMDLPQTDMPVDESLVDGLYVRKLLIPKGTFLVGKVHLQTCANFVERGDISILTETGCGRVKAGHFALSRAGIQKLGYAHEETVFVNVFRTDEQDISKVEDQIASAEQAIELEDGRLLCQ